MNSSCSPRKSLSTSPLKVRMNCEVYQANRLQGLQLTGIHRQGTKVALACLSSSVSITVARPQRPLIIALLTPYLLNTSLSATQYREGEKHSIGKHRIQMMEGAKSTIIMVLIHTLIWCIYRQLANT